MRNTGLFLILTAVATVVAVVGRVSADSDHETVAATLGAIAENPGLYGLGGAGRFVSGVTLVAAGWCLFAVPGDVGRGRSAVVPLLFAVSGALTVCSGALAVGLANMPAEWMDVAGLERVGLSHQEATMWLRWFTGAAGFALAGVALIVIGWRQRRAGGFARAGRACVRAARGGDPVRLARRRDGRAHDHRHSLPRLARRRRRHAPEGAGVDSGLMPPGCRRAP